MGPLAGLSFVYSWDGVFCSSAPHPATLLSWPKHSPVSSPPPLLLLLLLLVVVVVVGGGEQALTPEMQSVYVVEIS